MIKRNNKNKCNSLDYPSDYISIRDELTSPYGLDMGHLNKNYIDYKKIHLKINNDYFYKK